MSIAVYQEMIVQSAIINPVFLKRFNRRSSLKVLRKIHGQASFAFFFKIFIFTKLMIFIFDE